MKSLGRFLAAIAATLLLARPSIAQTSGASGLTERFQPTPAGDAMFGVAAPSTPGHLVPRAVAVFDYARRPLSIQEGGTRRAIVSDQGFLHIGASLPLWDRLLFSVDVPIALLQSGDSPVVAGTRFQSPSSVQMGDVRLGGRVRLYGDFWDPVQVGLGGYVWVPSAPAGSFAGDGAVRGEPQLLVGGRFQHFVWNMSLGTVLRGSTHPHSLDAGAGAAVVLGENFAQIGPELTVSAPLSKDTLTTNTATFATASSTSSELLFGAKLRPLSALVLGAGAGPGLTNGWGTPAFFAVGSIGYEPLPERPREADRDGDGIADSVDACPDKSGVRSDDPKKNGCPEDRDDDGIPDEVDACPDEKGVASSDPKKHGCPADRDSDGDGIVDSVDACPNEKGVASSDPKKHGCPADEDADDDGIADSEDACPNEKGLPDPDPQHNGCPRVRVTASEVVITQQIKFLFRASRMDQTVDPVSESMLAEVRDAIEGHPDIKAIELQGHADVIGTDSYNMRLSLARAQAVREWLIAHGIPGDKLVVKGYGSAIPQATNDSPAGRQQNRRVEFKIIRGDD